MPSLGRVYRAALPRNEAIDASKEPEEYRAKGGAQQGLREHRPEHELRVPSTDPKFSVKDKREDEFKNTAPQAEDDRQKRDPERAPQS